MQDPSQDYRELWMPDTKRKKARCDLASQISCKGGRHTLWGKSCEYWNTCNTECPEDFPWIDNPSGAKRVGGCTNHGEGPVEYRSKIIDEEGQPPYSVPVPARAQD
jgi:hypothetical protein